MTHEIWALQNQFVGDNAQVLALADRLRKPYKVRRVLSGVAGKLPNILLGALEKPPIAPDSDPLEPPWPDLVISASRRTVPIARYIRKQSRGRAKLVQIGGPRAPLKWFDLVVTTPQFRLPDDHNVVHCTLPLHAPPPKPDEHIRRHVAQRFEHCPTPRIALLVGGGSETFIFTPLAAARMARRVQRYARAIGASLLVATSHRTSPAAVAAIERALEPPFFMHKWTPPRTPRSDPRHHIENPYWIMLNAAQRVVVTGDSVTMLADACDAQKDVAVYDIMPKWRLLRKTRSALQDQLARKGFWSPAPNPVLVHKALYRGRHATPFDADPEHKKNMRPVENALDRVAQRVLRLLDAPDTPKSP